MASRKELKMIAKESLTEKWGISIGLLLMLCAIGILLCIVPFIGLILLLTLCPSFIYIIPQSFFYIKRNNNISISEIFFSLFKNLKIYWGITLRIFQKIFIYILPYAFGIILLGIAENKNSMLLENIAVFIAFIGYILFFIQSLYYTQAIYIITDNPTLSCKDAVIKSKELMAGHRFEYFILKLSFFGWGALSYFTCGLGDLYLKPYMYTTLAAYYDDLASIENYTKENNNEVI